MGGRFIDPGSCDRCEVDVGLQLVAGRWLCSGCRDELRRARGGPL